MTNIDIHQFRLELEAAISTLKPVFESSLKKRFPELHKKLYEVTAFSNRKGRKFVTRIWYVMNELTNYPQCSVCTKPITKDVYRRTDPRMDYCSLGCSVASEKTQQKMKENSLAKWGYDNPNKSPIVKAGTKKRCLEKHGVESTNQLESVSKKKSASLKKTYNDPVKKKIIFGKIAAAMLAKTGYDHINKTPKRRRELSEQGKNPEIIAAHAKSKARNFYLKKLCANEYVTPNFTCEEWTSIGVDEKADKIFSWHCNECGRNFNSKFMHYCVPDTHKTAYARCFYCHPNLTYSSAEEKEFGRFVESTCSDKYEVLFCKEENYKVIAPFQLDVIVKDKITHEIVLAFEFDGSMWHSEQLDSEVDRQLNKTLLCEQHNIKLVHIFEDEWAEDTKEKTKEFVCKLLANPNIIQYEQLDDNTIKVDRSKFCKLCIPAEYECIEESPAEYVKRKSSHNDIYDVGDCGYLTLMKKKESFQDE